ncbi:MAG: enoyl-CoA hydratase/isomerase family protein [Solirubrobacterales bacterium]
MSVDFEVDSAGVALITLNRPERLNAIDAEHYELLSRAWCRVRDEEQIRAAVITGAGERAFSVGADLKTFIGSPPPLADNWLTQRGQLLNRGLEVWKPVVAAVNGLCLGGGTTLLFATDLRVAVAAASFALPEVKRGVLAGNGGTQRALAQLPHAIAMELLLTGGELSAERALHFGLVNRVVAREQLLAGALELARTTAANAPLAVQASKELAIRSRDMDLAAGLRLEQSWLRMLQQTEDVAEGRRAFAEKRPPRFQGR